MTTTQNPSPYSLALIGIARGMAHNVDRIPEVVLSTFNRYALPVLSSLRGEA